MTYFLPSRDLPSLRYGVSQDAIYTGVVRIAHALGVAEGQVEDVYVVLDGQHLPDEDGEEHQDDTFEKDTVVRWLMGVSSLKWIHDHLQDHNQIIEDIVQRASHLLTICAGQMASGTVHRVFHISSSVQVHANEAALVEDSLGCRTWGSAPLLASILSTGASLEGPSLRTLEIGAGTGISGLALAQALKNAQTPATVNLTDFHEHVLNNLRTNTIMNGWGNKQHDQIVSVQVNALDWNLDSSSDKLQDQALYDCLIGADCVYDTRHSKLIQDVANTYLTKSNIRTLPQDAPMYVGYNIGSLQGKFVLVSPLRDAYQKEFASIEENFPYWSTAANQLSSPRLCITHKYNVTGRDDFGPPSVRFDGGSEHRKTFYYTSQADLVDGKQSIQYFLYVIEWCQSTDRA